MVYRYRVLNEAANYVLVVEWSGRHGIEHPTKFAIYTLRSFGWPTEQNAELRYYYCSNGILGTKEAFDWPVEKLLETFKLIEFDGSVSIGWSSSRLSRVTAK